MSRRRPGQADAATGDVLVTARDEKDQVEILSGIFEGKTLGTPIACIIKNTSQRSQDYEKIKTNPRTGHADDVWKQKFGHTDHRGGGRASARETASRVIAGSIANMFLKQKYPEIKITSFVSQIGPMQLTEDDRAHWEKNQNTESYTARFPTQKSDEVRTMLLKAKEAGDSYGGTIETWIDNAPKGLGEPVFQKLKAQLAQAMMSIGATTSFEIGEGKSLISKKGSKSTKTQPQALTAA